MSDPERNWIHRLEPERTEERAELEEAPLRHVPRLFAGGVVAVAGILEVLGFVHDDLGILRIAAIAAAAAIIAVAEWMHRRTDGRGVAA